MSKFSLTNLFGMTIRESATDGSDFTNPDADYRRLFLGEDGTLHLKDSAGTVTDVAGAAGAMATDALWDAAGDLAQGTGANTGAKLGAGTAGQFLKSGGAATANAWASRELDYVQKTSNSSITGTSAGAADTLVTGASVAYDGATIVIIEFYAPFATPDTALSGRDLTIGIFESTTEVARVAYIAGLVTGPVYCVIHGAYRFTPSNASHTYNVKAWVSAGTGLVGGGAGAGAANAPMFMRITRAL